MNKSAKAPLVATVALAGAVIFFTSCRRESVTSQKSPDSTQPQQAARAFFEAFAREDWTRAAEFWPSALPPIDDRVKGALGGLQLVKLDDPRKKQPPFKVGIYAGPWQPGAGDPWIPYEIRTKIGSVRKADLRLTWTGSSWQLAGGL